MMGALCVRACGAVPGAVLELIMAGRTARARMYDRGLAGAIASCSPRAGIRRRGRMRLSPCYGHAEVADSLH